ncbi:MAG: eukaryotic-like serine/threonine-protein kinase [Gemmatimonadales bacterium]|nr:eukaryotic-like serine/threonine-protein kinase [Gemmatimonadales bacterium]
MAVPTGAERTPTPKLLQNRIPARWAFFSTAVLSLLVMSLWLRAKAPASGEPVRTAVRPNSMAILPFINASPDSADDYLGPGVAAELTRVLGRLPGLRVADRLSAFAAPRDRDPQATGRRLNVGTMLQGSVRRSGERLRVTARLVDVDEGFDLWSETYERLPDEIFAVQDDIRSAVAATLRLAGVADSTAAPERPTTSLAAYDAYLAGRYLLDQRIPGAAPRAIDYLTRAVRLDTSFALANAALAEAYLRRGDIEALAPLVAAPQAKQAALRALELDSTLAEAHVTLGTVRFGYDRDWNRAETEFRRAISLEPTSPGAYAQYSRYLLAMGRIDDSRAASESALRLSPVSPLMMQHLAWHYLHARQYDRAREALWRAIEMDSTAWRPQFDLAAVELVAGNLPEAEARLRIPLEVAPERAEVQVALGQVYAGSGRTEEAKAILQRLRQAGERRYVSPYLIACLQASLGMKAQALAQLERSVRERSDLAVYLRIDPRVDSLRTDRRFGRLLRQLRLP